MGKYKYKLDALRKSMREGYTVFNTKLREVLTHIHNIAEENDFDDKYCVVGGVAVQLYLAKEAGTSVRKYLRPTSDIDIATLRNEKGASLYEYLFPHSQDYRNRENLYNLKIDGVWINIDIGKATGIDENYFKKIIEDSQMIELPSNGKRKKAVRVISLEDLLLTKLDGFVNGGREKDLKDIEMLLEYCGKRFDLEKLDQRVETYFSDDDRFMQAYEYIKNILSGD